jgi:hypothetical protein
VASLRGFGDLDGAAVAWLHESVFRRLGHVRASRRSHYAHPRWRDSPSCLPRPRVPSMRLDELPEADSGSARFYGCDVDSAGDMRAVRSLECVDCGRVSEDDEPGWTARLTVDEDEPAEAVIYCPECDEREFDTETSRPNGEVKQMDEAHRPRKRFDMYADKFNHISVAIDLYEDTTPEQAEQALIWLAGEIRK